MAIEFFFCRIYDSTQKLVAYWYLRKQGNDFVLSFRYISHPHVLQRHETAEAAVKAFYKSYIAYLLDIRDRLEFNLKLAHNLVKPPKGFRARQYSRDEKQRAIDKYNAFYREARRDLAREIQRLRDKGWPTPAMDQLPWEEDYYSAAANAANRTKHIAAYRQVSVQTNRDAVIRDDGADTAREAALQIGETLFPELRLWPIAPVFKIIVR